MNAKYKDGSISFDFHEFIQSAPTEDRVEMIEDLACDEAVIKHVADQIIERWTENFSSGGSMVTAQADPSWSALDVAWRRVAKASGDVAKREIERLEDALRAAKKETQDLREEMERRRHTY